MSQQCFAIFPKKEKGKRHRWDMHTKVSCVRHEYDTSNEVSVLPKEYITNTIKSFLTLVHEPIRLECKPHSRNLEAFRFYTLKF